MATINPELRMRICPVCSGTMNISERFFIKGWRYEVYKCDQCDYELEEETGI